MHPGCKMDECGMFYPRTMSESYLAASDQFPVILMTGLRQVGKTTCSTM